MRGIDYFFEQDYVSSIIDSRPRRLTKSNCGLPAERGSSMKKFALVAAVLLLSTGFVFAGSFPPANPADVNASVVVKAALAGYLTISGMTNETDIVLN